MPAGRLNTFFGNNSVNSDQISTDSITNEKIASNAITTSKIANSAVTTDKIANSSTTSDKLASESVTNAKLASSSLTISKFASTDKSSLLYAITARPGSAVITNGSVENIVVYEGGTGYSPSNPPTVTIDASPTGDTATAVAVVNGSGVITSITITNPGSGYTSVPNVTIPIGTSQAKAVAYTIVNGLSAKDALNEGIGSEQAGFFITSDKKVKAVGYNSYYKNGNGIGNYISPLPVEVGISTNSATKIVPSKVYAAYNNTYIIDIYGQVYSCGYNGNGENGLGNTNDTPIFNLISPSNFNNKPVVKLAFFSNHVANTVIAITADKKAYGWGYQNYNYLGTPTTAVVLSPTAVASAYSISDAQIINGNTYGNTLLLEEGTGRVLVIGYNGYGQLSQGNTTDRSTFGYYLKSAGVNLGDGAEGKVIKIAGSGDGSGGLTIMLTANGKVFTAGYNAYGQLGDGTTTSTNAGYCQEVMSSGAVDIYVPTSTGGSGCIFIKKSDGSLWAAGYNTQGCFGDGSAINTSYPTLKQVFNPTTMGTTVSKFIIAAGNAYHSSYVLGANGILYAAGYNGNGQLGDGTTTDRNSWIQTCLNPGDTSIVDFRIDSYGHIINPRVLMSDGKVYTCGYNGNFQLGNGYSYAYYASWNNILF